MTYKNVINENLKSEKKGICPPLNVNYAIMVKYGGKGVWED